MSFLEKIVNIFKSKKNIYLVDSTDNKEFLESELEGENLIGLDTEFDWRRTYFPILSLIQISTINKIFLIDVLKIKNIIFLKKILESPEIRIILHASRSDATALSSVHDIKIKNVFDIQVAERFISREKNKNYGAIVREYLKVNLEKSETNSNWLLRPFTPNQLKYASEDVEFLIDIYKKQISKLKEINKYEEVIENSNKEALLGNQKLFVSRLEKIKKYSNQEKKIFMWREIEASKKNVPSSYIFKNKLLKEISKIISSGREFQKLNGIINDKDLNNLLEFIQK